MYMLVTFSNGGKDIARLQKVQNFAVRIVTGARRYDHITPMVKKLHWLPVAKQPHHPCEISLRQRSHVHTIYTTEE